MPRVDLDFFDYFTVTAKSDTKHHQAQHFTFMPGKQCHETALLDSMTWHP